MERVVYGTRYVAHQFEQKLSLTNIFFDENSFPQYLPSQLRAMIRGLFTKLIKSKELERTDAALRLSILIEAEDVLYL
jgi:hypothetical protein